MTRQQKGMAMFQDWYFVLAVLICLSEVSRPAPEPTHCREVRFKNGKTFQPVMNCIYDPTMGEPRNQKPPHHLRANNCICLPPQELLCFKNPCQNGGICVVEAGSEECACAPGYSGRRCQTELPCSKNPCQNGGTCVVGTDDEECACAPGSSGGRCQTESCADYLCCANNVSGVYVVNPRGLGAFEVYCDMETDGGGWTLFQRRFSGLLPFNGSWMEFTHGFGNVIGNHWLGLEYIYRLANKKVKLRVDMKTLSGSPLYAKYDFKISNGSDFYRAFFSNYEGNAADSLSYHDGMPFSTYDSDNDLNEKKNCAKIRYGGWWYRNCFKVNLNGLYLTTTMSWGAESRRQVKESVMMVRATQ